MANERTSLPAGWPVLVTGAGGFVGGHVARRLAAAGLRVRAWSRRPVAGVAGDPPVEWFHGDLGRSDDVARAVAGMRGVVHVAGWVSLGADPERLSRRVNVEATASLLDASQKVGVERFVYTSTLWTVAAGTAERPANEQTPWNLEAVDSPYCRTKREAEALVLSRSRPGFRTSALCPAMVIGPRDPRPSSTRLLLIMARTPMVVIAGGGIPLVEVGVVALAHQRALERARAGARYIVAGPYCSYPQLARRVSQVAGRPRCVVRLPDCSFPLLRRFARLLTRLGGRWAGENLSEAAVAGGFLRLFVDGGLADREFGLVHTDPMRPLYEALDDHRRSGRAPWLVLRRPDVLDTPIPTGRASVPAADLWYDSGSPSVFDSDRRGSDGAAQGKPSVEA